MSPLCEQAVQTSLNCGVALLKVISPNDVGITGGHQKGFYLPKEVWEYFTPQAPQKGINHNHSVQITWNFGVTTQSTVKWYGQGTRSEYRITGFNRIRHFPALLPDKLGSVLVLIPETLNQFYAFILETDEDIEDYQSFLGIELLNRWTLYTVQNPAIQEQTCLQQRFEAFAHPLIDFPPTTEFAKEAQQTLLTCIQNFIQHPTDDQLEQLVQAEYTLFKIVEHKIYNPKLQQPFPSLEAFLKMAQTVLQRRKSRAGKSLEHHVSFLLNHAQIPFEDQVRVDGTKPDILIPNTQAYNDPKWPQDKLFMLGIKTTCKDRWRQITKEAPKITHKHLLTLQEGISSNQLREIAQSNISLVVPKSRHTHYPPEFRDQLLSIEDFILTVKHALNL